MDERLRILLAQLDVAWEMLRTRLEGLTDEEYFWEAETGCWSLRSDGARWFLEDQAPQPETPPLTTIAWRMCHIAISPLFRFDYTFGQRSLHIDAIVWPSTAEDAISFVTDTHLRWRTALSGLTPEQLDTVGLSQNPHGLDREVRFVDLLGWTNVEFIHHAAEIACLRDLFRARTAA